MNCEDMNYEEMNKTRYYCIELALTCALGGINDTRNTKLIMHSPLNLLISLANLLQFSVIQGTIALSLAGVNVGDTIFLRRFQLLSPFIKASILLVL